MESERTQQAERAAAEQAADARRKSELKKRLAAEEEAARVAALQRQRELESATRRAWINRHIYPSDYKAREHCYMCIDLHNVGAEPPPAPAK